MGHMKDKMRMNMQSNQLAQISLYVQEIIFCFRRQDFYHGQQVLQKVIQELSLFLSVSGKSLEQEAVSNIMQTLQAILDAQGNNDYVLVADLLEAQLKPFVDIVLEMVLSENEEKVDYFEKNISALEKNKNADYQTLIKKICAHVTRAKSPLYVVEQTNLGVYTIRYNGKQSFYYHSNINPVEEGKQFAHYYAKPDVFHYTIIGFGMGYHIYQLLQQDRRYQVHAVECNLDVLTQAFIYCDLQELLSHPRFRLTYCENAEIGKMLDSTDTVLLIHYPSLLALEESAVKNALQSYFISMSSMYAQGHLLDWNFYDNMQLKDSSVDTIKDLFLGKSIIYVGGGPSLEYYVDYLREQCNDNEKVVICASTVYKKLLENNVVPDYVIIIDPNDIMVNHIKGTPKTTSDMLYLSTACNKAITEFSGKRYILFQKGYKPAEDYANENFFTTFETGGSVSTLAIDFALRCQCKELITLGLDLAYTDNKTHSFDAESANTTNFMQVKGVLGGTVPTTNVLNTYKVWIEKRVRSEKNIRLVNLSRGAYIEGMENVSML